MSKKRKQNILVVCHDAGTAENISAYVKKYQNRYVFFCFVSGPGHSIFKRKKLAGLFVPSRTKAEALLVSGNLAFVLTGTSWASPVELDFINTARRYGVKSVTYLEHWVNIRERFNYPKKNWENNLPDAFWADNVYTRALAHKFFKRIPCTLVPNLYFKEMKQGYWKIKKRTSGPADAILFMSQPIGVNRGPANHDHLFSFSEFEILESILWHLSARHAKHIVIICYHPSERKDKYDRIIKKYAPKVRIAKQSGNRFKDLARAKAVVGISSNILVVAKACDPRKKVVSFIPDKKTPFPIPYTEITRVRNITQLAKAIGI